ncbi:MAG: hypothetical protein ACP6IS_01680 [Candidatus Asgardarchaeia archaeon]
MRHSKVLFNLAILAALIAMTSLMVIYNPYSNTFVTSNSIVTISSTFHVESVMGITGISWDGQAFGFVSSPPTTIFRFDVGKRSYVENISLPSALFSLEVRGITYYNNHYFLLLFNETQNSYSLAEVNTNGTLQKINLLHSNGLELYGLTVDSAGFLYTFSKSSSSPSIQKINVNDYTLHLFSSIDIPSNVISSEYSIYDLAFGYNAVWAVDNAGQILKIRENEYSIIINVSDIILSENILGTYTEAEYIGCELVNDVFWISIGLRMQSGPVELRFVKLDATTLNSLSPTILQNTRSISASVVATAIVTVGGLAAVSSAMSPSAGESVSIGKEVLDRKRELEELKEAAALRKLVKKKRKKKKAFSLSSFGSALLGLALGIAIASFTFPFFNISTALIVSAVSIGFSTAVFGFFGTPLLLRIKRKYKVRVSTMRMFIILVSFLAAIYGLVMSPILIISLFGKLFGGLFLVISFITSIKMAVSESRKLEEMYKP